MTNIFKYRNVARTQLPANCDNDLIDVQAVLMYLDELKSKGQSFDLTADNYSKSNEYWELLDYLACPIGRPKYRKYINWIGVDSMNEHAKQIMTWVFSHAQA